MNKSDVVDLPEELQIMAAELAIDVVFVENETFLHCVDRTIKGKTAVPLGTTNTAKGVDLLEALKKVVKLYNKADVTIYMIHEDNELRAIAEEMEVLKGRTEHYKSASEPNTIDYHLSYYRSKLFML